MNALYSNAEVFRVELNENKCGHISIGSAPTRPLTLSENGISIKLLDSTKDLGIAIDSSFKLSLHCVQAFKRARATLFLIRRSFVSRTSKISIPLYSTFVRSHNEYGIQSASPYLKSIPRVHTSMFGASSMTSYSNGQRLSGSIL